MGVMGVPLWLPLMPTTAVDTVMVDMEVTDMVDTEDTAMVDTVAREKLKLPQKLMLKLITEVLDTDTVPDTDSDLTDMVGTVPDTDSATLDTVPDTVSDTAMVDTVARDPLMLTMDVDTVMEVTVMEVTDVDMEVTDTAVDTDTDTESKHFPLQTNQRNHSIQNYAILITAKASEHNFKQK